MAEGTALPVPEGRYRFEEAIGKGGSGNVYRAWDTQLQRNVAVKRLRADAEGVAEIQREAGILAALQHPNIVSIFDMGSDEEGIFVVMEMVRGQTLEDIADKKPLSLNGFARLVEQVCRGLSAAHALGLVHQDLKPANLMLHVHEDGSFTVKILDFGLAKSGEEIRMEFAEAPAHIFGSPVTISPEQIRGEGADARSDIYSLGCTFYYALLGRYPYTSDDVPELLRSHLYSQPTPLHLLRAEVPQPVSIVITRMMAAERHARPQTAEEVRLAIVGALRAPSAASRGTRVTSRMPSPGFRPPGSALPVPVGGVAPPGRASGPARKPPSMAAAAVIIFLLLGVAVWLYLHRAEYFKAQPIAEATPSPEASPAPEASASPSASATPTRVDPLNYLALSNAAGQTVTVEGKIVDYADDDVLKMRELKFSNENLNALVLDFPDTKFTEEAVKAYVGKQIRVTGRISESIGSYRIVIQKENDISEIPSGE